MLRKLERLINEQTGPINLIALADQLQAEPGAVAGMLTTLARKGRLTAVPAQCAACDTCPIQKACQLPTRRAVTFHK